MNNIVKKLKKRRNSSIVKTTVEIGTKITHGNIVGAIIKAVSGASIVLKNTRAIELIDRVCHDNEDAKRDLLAILSNENNELYEIIINVVIKTIDESNAIKRFLLAKVMSHYIENNGFDYFHEMLFNNINLFNDADFKNILEIDNQIKANQIMLDRRSEWRKFEVTNENDHLVVTILKSISLQILLRGADGLGSNLENGKLKVIRISHYLNYFDILVDYLTQLFNNGAGNNG